MIFGGASTRPPPTVVTAESLRSGPEKSVDRERPALERVASGDASGVSYLLDRYGALVWSIVRRQVGPEAAEDLVQEIFIEIWKSADRYDAERASEATFITTIARRRVIDYRRKQGRRPEIEDLGEVEETPLPDPELARIDLGDDARVALEALAQLKPDQRTVLRLAIVDGLTHTQIAEVTRMPLGTVKSHARRGLERVRALLGERRQPQGEGP